MSQVMRDSFRESDLLFRFGGEEFVVVTENLNMHGAKTAFERFRHAVEQFDFPQVGQVTISFGAAKVSSADVVHAVLDKADKALYYAKQNGKNQVCFYDDLIEKGAIEPPQIKLNQDIELF